MIDSHTHLYWEKFDQDRDQVMERARSAGVEGFIVVGIDIETCGKALEMARGDDSIYATAGFHPNNLTGITEDDWQALDGFLQEDSVIAVGETGLDYYWDDTTPAQQKDALSRHFELARKHDLPLIIHTRDSIADFLETLGQEAPGLRGVMHCFSGDAEQMEETIRLGFDISFAGPLTYKKSNDLRAACVAVPEDRFHIETDCPFLPPQSRRGKRNEPALVREVAEKVAELRGWTLAETMQKTAANTRRLFNLPA
ncbi:MAG: TatD DNase family protein [Planctomycetota bacterium]|jgi:TatD DNase family protein